MYSANLIIRQQTERLLLLALISAPARTNTEAAPHADRL
ncbi:MAG: hypothetical protein ACI89J_001277 [Hyphomicrobiaceae bacterium]